MSFQHSAFQTTGFQTEGTAAVVGPTVGNTIRAGVWETANNVIGRCLSLFVIFTIWTL
jgi:hypothetical protein